MGECDARIEDEMNVIENARTAVIHIGLDSRPQSATGDGLRAWERCVICMRIDA